MSIPAEESPIVISVVSYLNSRPFILGLKSAAFSKQIVIEEDIPSVCAQKIILGKANIGLVPVAILPELTNYEIISDFCIGADGEVSSVVLLSEVPIEEIHTILLDYQSRTSVMLTKILAKHFWKIHPVWTEAGESYENSIKGKIAGVVIGDRALKLKTKFPFVYDLSSEWKKLTGLPFVFACWVSTVSLSDQFLREFNSALNSGLSRVDEISKTENSFLTSDEIRHYLTKNINYSFDEKKKKAMELFHQMSLTV